MRERDRSVTVSEKVTRRNRNVSASDTNVTIFSHSFRCAAMSEKLLPTKRDQNVTETYLKFDRTSQRVLPTARLLLEIVARHCVTIAFCDVGAGCSATFARFLLLGWGIPK